MTPTNTTPATQSEEIAKLVLAEVKEKNASCIRTFEVLDQKVTFFITASLLFASSIASIIIYSFSQTFYILGIAASFTFALLYHILYLLAKIVTPIDITHQGDTPKVIRSHIKVDTSYKTNLEVLTDFYGEKIRINEANNNKKAEQLRWAIWLLISAPYLFLAIYLVGEIPQFLFAVFHDFVG